ncbi:uncharacterized protein V3H86_013747 [Mergus octosetaceus]
MAEAAVGPRGLCGAALVGLSWGAALVGRCCGAALVGLSRGAAALLGTPGFARAHALGVAALVGLEPALRRGADPQGLLASPHNLLEARLVASAGRWTALLLGALLVASLPLAQPGGGRRGALLRAAGRLAVGATVMAAAAPRLFAALEAAAGLRPSPQAFGLVLCGLGLGEELGALGRLLHPPRGASGDARVATDSRRATRDDWVATDARRATGDVWMATDGRRATGDNWVATDRRMATRDDWVATNTRMATRDDWVATDRRMATRDNWLATNTRMATDTLMAPGATRLAAAPQVATEEPKLVATAPLCLLFLLNAGLLLLWQGALVATLAYRCHWAANAAGAGLGWAAWALTYRLWYRCPCSPGRPGLGLRPRGVGGG